MGSGGTCFCCRLRESWGAAWGVPALWPLATLVPRVTPTLAGPKSAPSMGADGSLLPFRVPTLCHLPGLPQDPGWYQGTPEAISFIFRWKNEGPRGLPTSSSSQVQLGPCNPPPPCRPAGQAACAQHRPPPGPLGCRPHHTQFPCSKGCRPGAWSGPQSRPGCIPRAGPGPRTPRGRTAPTRSLRHTRRTDSC